MKIKALCLICFLFAGCSKEVQYAGHTEAQWQQDMSSVNADERATAAIALSHFNTVSSKMVLHSSESDDDCVVRLNVAQSLYTFDHNDPAVYRIMRSVINDKLGWSVTDRIKGLLRTMGKDAVQLGEDVQQVFEAAPNSKQKRWQECLDAIKG